MAVSQTSEERIQWLERHNGRGLQSRLEELLTEFQWAVSTVTVGSGCRINDILVGGSFIDSETDHPADIDIAVITDKPPCSAVKDGFWRYINDQSVLDTSIDVDCVWVLGEGELPDGGLDSTQYSVQTAEVVDLHEYAERDARR